ncbi:hypothetical protein QQP08_020679, partial [Theobroma cacao]
PTLLLLSYGNEFLAFLPFAASSSSFSPPGGDTEAEALPPPPPADAPQLPPSTFEPRPQQQHQPSGTGVNWFVGCIHIVLCKLLMHY